MRFQGIAILRNSNAMHRHCWNNVKIRVFISNNHSSRLISRWDHRRCLSLVFLAPPVSTGTIERRSTLRQSKFFECNCARCADPTECQTYLSAFKCQKCSVGNVLPLKPLQLHTNWRCDRCSYRLNAAVVARIDNQLNNEFDAIGPNDVQKYHLHLSLLFKQYSININYILIINK